MTHTCQFVPVEVRELMGGILYQTPVDSQTENKNMSVFVVSACSCGKAKKKPLTWVEDE